MNMQMEILIRLVSTQKQKIHHILQIQQHNNAISAKSS